MTHTEPAILLSQHARTRMQQRAIRLDGIDLLFRFGECRYAGHGAESYYFTRQSWRQVEAHLGAQIGAYERYRNIYVVVADGVVVTTAHRH